MDSKQIIDRVVDKIFALGWKRVALVSLAVILLLTLGMTLYKRSQPGYTVSKYDKETGETLSTQPNVTPESTDGQSRVSILGTSSLYKMGAEGLSLNQVALLNEDLGTNALKSLGEHDDVLKVVDPSYSREDYTVKAALKYSGKGHSATLVFSLDSVDSFNYKIIKEGKTVYQSGQLITAGPNYTGDGAPPEEQ